MFMQTQKDLKLSF